MNYLNFPWSIQHTINLQTTGQILHIDPLMMELYELSVLSLLILV